MSSSLSMMGVKDNTGEIIERWAKEDKRIVALHQEKPR